MANLKTSAEAAGDPVKIEDLFRIASYVSPGVYVSASISGQHLADFISTFPAGADKQIQFNNAGAFGASAKLTWNDPIALLVLGSPGSNPIISSATGDAGSPDATDFFLTAADAFDDGMASPGEGGSFHFVAGTGVNGGDGGGVNFTAGSGESAGNITFSGFSGVNGTGTSVLFTAGNGGGTGNNGGSQTFRAAYGSDVTANPGQINLLGDSDVAITSVPGGIFIAPGARDFDFTQSGDVVIDLDKNAIGIAGNLFLINLPTSDPGIPGAVYRTAGALLISI